METEGSLPHSQVPALGLRHVFVFRDYAQYIYIFLLFVNLFHNSNEMQEVTYTTNLFIELNVQQRRHVSALFYGAIFRSSMVLIRKKSTISVGGAVHCG